MSIAFAGVLARDEGRERSIGSAPFIPTAGPGRPWTRRGPALLSALAFLIHAACGGRYGIARDELYFIACGRRLAADFVDQPPGIAVVARLAHGLFGTWVPGLRLIPWLASAATVWLAGRLAARLGAGPFGAALASAGALAVPVLLALGHYLTMNVFELLLATALALILLRLVQGEDPRLWVAAGTLAGLSALFKYTSALLAVAWLAGLVVTPERRALRTRWALAGAIAGLLAVLPNAAWQAANGFPFLELVENGRRYKNAPFAVHEFLSALVVEGNPLAAPLWAGGLAWLGLSRTSSPARFLGLGAALYLLALLATEGKSYYFAPALPILLAAGGAAAEGLLRPAPIRAGALSLLLLSGLALAPFAVPLLSEERFVAYQAALGRRPRALERSRLGVLPMIYADQHGWQDLAAAVARATARLSPEERARAVVFGQNYGEAAAIDVYGPALGLPPAVSGHNQYFLWGVPAGRGDPSIVVGDEREDCGGFFRERQLVAQVPPSPWVMPYENGRLIWICRGARAPVGEIWPALRHYQ
jgi:4-amino-4-deoxy-L-arabinose transferase-like glycosyltransferase